MGKTLKEIIKGYHIFLPKGWKRAAIYTVFPLLVMGICILAGLNLAELNLPAAGFVLVFPGSCILWADGIIYYLIFGGFADKDSGHMEYMKSSGRGSEVYHRALVSDAVRRFGSISLVFVTVVIIVPASLDMDIQMVFFLAGAFCIACLMAFAVSFIMGFVQNIMLALLVLGIVEIVYCIAEIFFYTVVKKGIHVGLLAAIIFFTGGLAFILIRGQVVFLSKKMEGWYYDI